MLPTYTCVYLKNQTISYGGEPAIAFVLNTTLNDWVMGEIHLLGSYPAGVGSEQSHRGSSDGGRCSKSPLVHVLIP